MMGGSLASSIKSKKLAKKIYAYDKNISSLKYAKEKKLIAKATQNYKLV